MRFLPLVLALLAVPASAQSPHGAILIYSGTSGYRHDSIPAGVAAVTRLARARGLQVVTSEDPRVFATPMLSRFRAIVLLSTTTDPKNPECEWLVGPRREALQKFLRRGGGIVAIHAAADSHYHWPWYSRMIGGHFARHPPNTATGVVSLTSPPDAVARGLPSIQLRTDEWYYFDDYDPTSRLIATLDPRSIGEADVNPNPMAWSRRVDGGRVFYTAMGHTRESYSEPYFLRLVGNGLDWAIARGARR